MVLRTAFWSAFTAAFYFPTADITTMYLYHHKDSDIEAYTNENLELIIKKQEEKIGITYPAERPAIEYILPEEYRILGLYGLYDDREDTIYLPSGILVKPEFNLSDFITTIATFNSTADVKRALDHELAHFYCDKVREKALGKNYPTLQIFILFPEERIAYKLINEGIARYFENSLNGEYKRPYPFEKWPTQLEEFSNDVFYQGGYALVKPVIDQYGEKGIQFLLFNPPTPDELFTPKEYKERMLRDIAKLQ